MVSVSIITPCVGPTRFLESALQSVQVQGIARLQHVVVIGNLPDDTTAILKPHERNIIQISKPFHNQAQAVNAGLARASGDIIGWLNSDDVYRPRTLPSVVQFFRTHPQVDVVYGHIDVMNEEGHVVRTSRVRRCSAGSLRGRCLLWQPAVFFRRDLLRRCGLLDQKLKYWMDYEYWLRLADASARFARLPLVLAGSRQYQDIGRPDAKARNDEDAASVEVVRMLSERDGYVHSRWLMQYAKTMANRDQRAGRSTRGRAGHLFSHVMRSARIWSPDQSRPLARARMAACCALDEIAGRLRQRRRERRDLKRKIFRLRHHAPRALSLPASYLRCRPMEKTPLISVVTPNFNGANYLEETIRSVVEQSYPSIQYVVLDGGSKDRSVEIIRRYEEHLTHWESGRDRGQAHAINQGLQRTTGEIMAYLNSDDLILPGALGYVANYFSRHPDVDVVYGHRILINEGGDEIGRWVLPPHDDRTLPWADYIPQETMFWRRRAWEAAGARIDETFQFAMDWDLVLRFRDAGLRFARVPRFLGAFRVTKEQKTGSLIQTVGKREMDQLRLRVLGHVPTPRETHKVLKPYFLRRRLYERLYRLGVVRY